MLNSNVSFSLESNTASSRPKRTQRRKKSIKPAVFNATGERIYCICQDEDNGSLMLQCDWCEDWFHGVCLGLTDKQVDSLSTYCCADCDGTEWPKYLVDAATSPAGKAARMAAVPADLYFTSPFSYSASSIVDTHANGLSSTIPITAINPSAVMPSNALYSSITNGMQYQNSTTSLLPSSPDVPLSSKPTKLSKKEKKLKSTLQTPSISAKDKLSHNDVKSVMDTSVVSQEQKRKSLSDSRPLAMSASTATPSIKRTKLSVEPKRAKSVDHTASTSSQSSIDPLRAAFLSHFTATFRDIYEWAKTHKEELGEPLHASIQLDDYNGMAKKVEQALFDTTHILKNGVRVVSDQYKAKFRSLRYNLMDVTNTRLRKRILLSGKQYLDADALVRLSPDELGNEEMKETADRVKRQSLKNAFKPRVETPQIVRDFSKGNSQLVENVSEWGKSTDSRDKHGTITPRISNVDRDGQVSMSSGTSTNITLQRKKKTDTLDDLIASMNGSNAIRDTPIISNEEKKLKPRATTNIAVTSGYGSDYEEQPLSPFDSIASSSDDEPSKKSTVSSLAGNRQNQPHKDSSPIVWKGTVHMPQVGKFVGSARQVGGQWVQPAATWMSILETTMDISGRIPIDRVQSYLHGRTSSGNGVLVVVEFKSTSNVDQPTAVDGLQTLVDYFASRDRCAVIGQHLAAVKDMYLVPAKASTPLPSLLTTIPGDVRIDAHSTRDRLFGLLLLARDFVVARNLGGLISTKPTLSVGTTSTTVNGTVGVTTNTTTSTTASTTANATVSNDKDGSLKRRNGQSATELSTQPKISTDIPSVTTAAVMVLPTLASLSTGAMPQVHSSLTGLLTSISKPTTSTLTSNLLPTLSALPSLASSTTSQTQSYPSTSSSIPQQPLARLDISALSTLLPSLAGVGGMNQTYQDVQTLHNLMTQAGLHLPSQNDTTGNGDVSQMLASLVGNHPVSSHSTPSGEYTYLQPQLHGSDRHADVGDAVQGYASTYHHTGGHRGDRNEYRGRGGRYRYNGGRGRGEHSRGTNSGYHDRYHGNSGYHR
ncbi:hypothetical protein BDV3_003113 [Batrachochytrium dendrobatidis]